MYILYCIVFFQAEDGIRDLVRSRGLGDVYKRQGGILAAAGLYALQNNIERLKEDHEKAKYLAERINANPNLEIDMNAVQTNILLFHPKTISVEEGLKPVSYTHLTLPTSDLV